MNIKLKDLILQEAASSACVKKFGDYLFGEYSKWYGENKEDDTKLESNYFDYIQKWLSGDYDFIEKPAFLIKSFKDLHKCMSSYPEILKPKTNILYRALNKKTEDFEKNLKNGKYYYSPHSEIQSWTIKEQVAKKFFRTRSNDYTKIFIIKYKFPKNELLFNANFLQTLFSQFGALEQEWEVIRISKKPILCDYEILR